MWNVNLLWTVCIQCKFLLFLISLILFRFSIYLFVFSLDPLVTKNQTLNVSRNLLLLFQTKKRRGQASSPLFTLKSQQKTSADIWCLVHIWFLVTGWSNEKNNLFNLLDGHAGYIFCMWSNDADYTRCCWYHHIFS